MKTRYRLYAGYYEAVISTRILRRPYTHVSDHFTLENAVRAAGRMDPEAVVFDSDLAGEAAALYFGTPFLEEDLQKITTFDGAAHEIAKGLTQYTLYALFKRFRCKVDGLDLRDITNFIAIKAHISPKKAASQLADKTFAEARDVIAPYVPETEYACFAAS
jgi:hypothetical protein